MRHRVLAPLLAGLLVLASGCSVGNGNEEEILEGNDIPTPDETPIVEPVTPNPATDLERPDEEGS